MTNNKQQPLQEPKPRVMDYKTFQKYMKAIIKLVKIENKIDQGFSGTEVNIAYGYPTLEKELLQLLEWLLCCTDEDEWNKRVWDYSGTTLWREYEKASGNIPKLWKSIIKTNAEFEADIVCDFINESVWSERLCKRTYKTERHAYYKKVKEQGGMECYPLYYNKFEHYILVLKHLSDVEYAIGKLIEDLDLNIEFYYPSLWPEMEDLLIWAMRDKNEWIWYYVDILDFGNDINFTWHDGSRERIIGPTKEDYEESIRRDGNGNIIRFESIEELWERIIQDNEDSDKEQPRNETKKSVRT